MNAFAIEKDWWVSRALEIIFQMPIAESLVFKGGTSLSKAWKLINRFSEDIDLAINKEYFGFKGDLRKNQRDKLRKIAGAYTTNTFFEDLKKAFIKSGYTNLNFIIIQANESDQDPRVLEIYYPNVIKSNSDYILPRVQIEISCRSLREPYTIQTFGSLVDEYYSDKIFAKPLFKVPTVNSERTFLEKLFLLHEEFHRPIEKIRVNRLSRHLYDIYHLTKSGISEIAINDKKLYETIVAHRFKYSRVSKVDYNTLNPTMLNPIPITEIIGEWKKDYERMKEEMIYEENKPNFEDLIRNINELKDKLKSVDWKFELTFPKV
jgi:predicted nucleotidyltransferase component of viral defense system